jgi:hypothetical protein
MTPKRELCGTSESSSKFSLTIKKFLRLITCSPFVNKLMGQMSTPSSNSPRQYQDIHKFRASGHQDPSTLVDRRSRCIYVIHQDNSPPLYFLWIFNGKGALDIFLALLATQASLWFCPASARQHETIKWDLIQLCPSPDQEVCLVEPPFPEALQMQRDRD